MPGVGVEPSRPKWGQLMLSDRRSWTFRGPGLSGSENWSNDRRQRLRNRLKLVFLPNATEGPT
jgi:hypothetical protein